MRGGEGTGFELRQHLDGQSQQPERVCYRRTTFAHTSRDLLLAEMEFVCQPLVGTRFLDGIQVLALQVFDQRELERLAIVCVAHDDRDATEPGTLRGAEASLAGD